MNKKFTLLAAALMTVGTFTAASAASDVPSKEWTVGNYYYLKTTDDSYLALDGTKADSVIVNLKSATIIQYTIKGRFMSR